MIETALVRAGIAGTAMPAAGVAMASCGGGGCTGWPRALPGRKLGVRWFVGRRGLPIGRRREGEVAGAPRPRR